jgi:hypothetical protein
MELGETKPSPFSATPIRETLGHTEGAATPTDPDVRRSLARRKNWSGRWVVGVMRNVGIGAAAALAGCSAGLVGAMATGKLTLDLGCGRSLHQVGPLELYIEAPRDLVYEGLSSPYLGRTPSTLRGSLEVLERGQGMVLARHVSDLPVFGSLSYKAVTVETVQFEPPERIAFRHVRGPVPHALEEFVLREQREATVLTYRGELGIDFWALGQLAGKHWVAPQWLAQVETHLHEIKTSAEARSAARLRRAARS